MEKFFSLRSNLIQQTGMKVFFLTAITTILLTTFFNPSSAQQVSQGMSLYYRQFDFWIGDWPVQNPAGKQVGDNLVTSEQDG